jgi:hypothetical protein
MGAALDDVLKDWMVERDPEGVGQLCRDAHNELATLRAQVLPEAVVKAVRAYQKALQSTRWREREAAGTNLIEAIEADAKEREG